KRHVDVVAHGQRIEEIAYARHHSLPGAGLFELDDQVANVCLAEARETRGIVGDAVGAGAVGENPGVGPSRHRNALEGITNRKDLLERERHRTPSGPAGEYKRAVDVEEDEGASAQLSLRCGRYRRGVPWLMVLRQTRRAVLHSAGR